jgi:deoxycytidylate deaminase
MRKKIRRRIALALRMALKSPPQMHRMGCVIYHKNRLVGMGINYMDKTHPRSNHPYRHLHCEVDALLGVSSEDLYGSTLYVARIRSSGQGLAKPCPYCFTILYRAGVKDVFYTKNEYGIDYERIT